MSAQGLAREIGDRVKYGSERKIAFLLGAGASVNSKIKPAKAMVQDWIEILHERAEAYTKSEDPLTWADSDSLKIPDFDKNNLAASYSQVYELTYGHDPDAGYEYLERALRTATPSVGYYILSQLMQAGMGSLVMTTNFDNLVAETLMATSRVYPFVCGHESLSGFIPSIPTRPTIYKIHRDLLLGPKSRTTEIEELQSVVREKLQSFCRNHTLVVIGYGGNDPGLMKVLSSVGSGGYPSGLYWCYHEEDSVPNENVLSLVDAANGFVVPIRGFDELMVLLSDVIGLRVGIESIEEIATDRIRMIQDSLKRARLDFNNSTASDLNPLLGLMAKEAEVDRTDRSWWQWDLQANSASTENETERIYMEAIKALPNSAELAGNFANFLHLVQGDDDRAQEEYERAARLAPKMAGNLCNLANFLANIRKDRISADRLYQSALSIEPENAIFIGNYARFLHGKAGDDKVEAMYEKAIQISPDNAGIIGNFAAFLDNVRHDYDRAEKLYKLAVELDPSNANNIGNYALFLWNIRSNGYLAERMFRSAIRVEPKNSNNLANFGKVLLEGGQELEAWKHIAKAEATRAGKRVDVVDAELAMYKLICGDQVNFNSVLKRIKEIVCLHSVRTGNWSYEVLLDEAEREKHAHISWLRELANVLADRVSVNCLDSWHAWKSIQVHA